MTLNKKLLIFPLSNVIFFPETTLPLNIFEKRYLEMVNDSIKENKLIGIIQPKLNKKPAQNKNLDVYDVGCVGKIINCDETNDNRLLISLQGISRFTIEKEIKTDKPYRQFMVNYNNFEKDLDKNENEYTNKNQSDLINSIKLFCKKRGFIFNWSEVSKLTTYELVNTISMILPFTTEEKQGLLEAKSFKTRIETLNEIIKFYNIDNFENKTLQ